MTIKGCPYSFLDPGRQAIKETLTISSENFDSDAGADESVVHRHNVVETAEAMSSVEKPTPAPRPLRRSLSMQHREQAKVKVQLNFFSSSISFRCGF